MKRAIFLLLLLVLTMCCGISVSEGDGYTYVHDPRDNADAMADIVENPEAVYGFSPDSQSNWLYVELGYER